MWLPVELKGQKKMQMAPTICEDQSVKLLKSFKVAGTGFEPMTSGL